MFLDIFILENPALNRPKKKLLMNADSNVFARLYLDRAYQ